VARRAEETEVLSSQTRRREKSGSAAGMGESYGMKLEALRHMSNIPCFQGLKPAVAVARMPQLARAAFAFAAAKE
jgi:hypothetical protein